MEKVLFHTICGFSVRFAARRSSGRLIRMSPLLNRYKLQTLSVDVY